MIAALGTWVAKSALMSSPVGGFLKRFWKPLLLALVLVAAFIWHGRQVKAFGAERYAAGYAQRVAEESAEAARRTKRDAEITAPIRSKTDEKIRDTAVHADTLRVRGPGAAAACVDPVPAGAGGSKPGSGDADAAVDRVPDEEREPLIALPFGETVNRAERCDANLAELLAWREQHAKLSADRAAADRRTKP